MSILSDFTFITLESTGAVPIFTLKDSPTCIGKTLMSSVVPTAESNKRTWNFASNEISGSEFGFPITEPMKESLLVIEGSSFVPMATRPPGFTLSTKPAPVPKETISVVIGS